MSELRGQPDSRPEPTDSQHVESLAELRTPYNQADLVPTSRESPRVEATATRAEHPALSRLGDRIRQIVADRFGGGAEADTTRGGDAPREVHELEQPLFTKDYRLNLPEARFDRYLVRDAQNPIPLFDGPPTRSDVRQGEVGDCGVLATLGAVAGHRPDAIRNAIRQVGDGTYEVTLHEVQPALPKYAVSSPTGNTVTYRIDDELPVRNDRLSAPPVSALPGASAWVPLMEKALAGQDQGWSAARQAECDADWRITAKRTVDRQRLSDGKGPAPSEAPTGYDRLNTGSTLCMQADVLAELTGQTAEVRRIPDQQSLLDEFRNRLRDGKPIIVSTRERQGGETSPDAFLLFGHAYEVTDVVDGKIHLRNPWGDDSAPSPVDVTTFLEYYREIHRDGSRDGSYVTLR